MRIEDGEIDRQHEVAQVNGIGDDSVGDANAERIALEGGHRAAGALGDEYKHAAGGGEREERELLAQGAPQLAHGVGRS